MQLTEEDQNDILMIGGIEVFLPFSQEEAEGSVADDTTTAGEQSAMTVRKEEELEQTLGAAQADLEKSEHSEEWLNDFSHEAEESCSIGADSRRSRRRRRNEHSEEWLNIFSHEAEKTATGEVAEAEEEEAGNICFADLWDQFEALEERIKVQGMHIQQVKLEMDKEAWEIMMIFQIAKNFCS
jgi:hypothetical protein